MNSPVSPPTPDAKQPFRLSVSIGLAWAVAALALGGYLLHAYANLYGQIQVLDEGLYLVKGVLFTQGGFTPFQDYGPLTNHMPLAFLIPGWIQLVFGPGLETGRFFALAVALLLLVGLWVAADRLAGPWWAAAAVWLVVLNPTLVKVYSQAISEGLAACMLVWIVALGVGRERRLWQVLLAGALGGVIVLTRVNMLPVLPLFVLYVYWAHGRRMGHAALLAGAGVLILGHIVYWPNIMRLWANWLPSAVTPFLDGFRMQDGGQAAWHVTYDLPRLWSIFVAAIKDHLLSVLGIIWAWLTLALAPRPIGRQRSFKVVVLLTTLFAVLLALHSYAALGLDYCPYCLPLYLSFFSPLGLLSLAVAGAVTFELPRRWAKEASLAGFLLLPWLLGYRVSEGMVSSVLSTLVPRATGMRLLPGAVPLWQLLELKLAVSSLDLFHAAWTVLVLLFVGVILAAFLWGSILFFQGQAESGHKSLVIAAAVLLVLESSTASLAFGNRYTVYDCGANELATSQRVGTNLASLIPPNSSVYWAFAGPPTPLLYLNQPQIFAPQLNGIYSYRIGGDPSEVERFGYWNSALALQWLSQAEYVVANSQSMPDWLSDYVNSHGYRATELSSPVSQCQPDQHLLIFERQP